MANMNTTIIIRSNDAIKATCASHMPCGIALISDKHEHISTIWDDEPFVAAAHSYGKQKST